MQLQVWLDPVTLLNTFFWTLSDATSLQSSWFPFGFQYLLYLYKFLIYGNTHNKTDGKRLIETETEAERCKETERKRYKDRKMETGRHNKQNEKIFPSTMERKSQASL